MIEAPNCCKESLSVTILSHRDVTAALWQVALYRLFGLAPTENYQFSVINAALIGERTSS